MTTPEQNIATLHELYQNLGPGIDHLMKYARKAMTEDVVWLNLGFPTVNGLDELERFCQLCKATMGFHSNPILEWRNMWGYDNKVFFERKGSFADEKGQTIVAWDVFGVYEFNEEGKIFAARDYYDNAENYAMIEKNFGPDVLSAIRSQCVHPCRKDFDPASKPYQDLRFN